ncbi:formate-tetrahydrofolate ligase [Aureococcus anophagefferens]|nr:formate-tetrahydrofolate ligase [Aureococcus anophagefferens]
MGNKDVVVGAVAGAAAAYALATYLQVDKPTAAAAAASPRTAAAANSTTTTTDAEVIDGKAIAAQIRGEIKASVDAMALTARRGLAVVLVGERKDSATYVRMKKKAAAEIHGILVQLPLPSHVNEAAVLKRISVDKDADGFAALNVGNLCLRGGDDPSAVARARKMDATVTVCHSRTRDIAAVVRGADIVVAAIGKPEFIKGAWLKPGCVVIDVGINAVDAKARRPVGGADYEAAKSRDGAFRASRPSSPAPPFEAGTARLARAPDIAISQACTPCPSVRRPRGGRRATSSSWGRHKAKVDAGRVAARLAGAPEGSLVVVCGINPTPLGEGKSTTTIGLCQALGKNLGKRVVTTIRQPSQGPTFGIKGGAAGGGYSQVIPMEEFNLHMTGDIHAIVAANNLLAAAVDARVFHEATQKDEALFNRLCPLSKKKDAAIKRPLAASQRAKFARLDLDPATITWNRVLDTCDRFLRKVEIGRGPNEKGMTREAGFDIAVASEIMAVLALAADAADFRKRLGKMCVGRSRADGLHGGAMVTAEDLGCAGALAVLMKDALDPTLMQTIEGTPVLVHAGPFANIAHGNSSVVADKVGLKLVGEDGFVVTEAGFGADIGGEKCFDIKCRAGDLAPKCAVVVATVRAEAPRRRAARRQESRCASTPENLDVLGKGCANLAHHVDCLRRKFGVRVVVACNKFAGDSENELNLVKARAMAAGAHAAVVADHWAQGGDGAVDLADAVVAACASAKDEFTYLYDLEDPVKTKVAKICEGIYKAGEVTYSDEAEAQLAAYERQGLGGCPCASRRRSPLSTDAARRAESHGQRPRGPRAAGAGFLALRGDIMTVPGLPAAGLRHRRDHEKDRVPGSSGGADARAKRRVGTSTELSRLAWDEHR